MKAKYLLTLLLFTGLLSQAQAQYKKSDIVGPWQIDVEKFVKYMATLRKEKPDIKQELLAFMQYNIRFDFFEDGSMQMENYVGSFDSDIKYKGRWELKDSLLVRIMGKKDKRVSEKILKLTTTEMTLSSIKSPEFKMPLISLKPLLEKFNQTNQVNIKTKQITGSWKIVATSQKGNITLFGFTQNFESDGRLEKKTILGKPFNKKGEKETWKITGKNTIQVTAITKDKQTPTDQTILYFTKDEMILKDQRELTLLQRIK